MRHISEMTGDIKVNFSGYGSHASKLALLSFLKIACLKCIYLFFIFFRRVLVVLNLSSCAKNIQDTIKLVTYFVKLNNFQLGNLKFRIFASAKCDKFYQ